MTALYHLHRSGVPRVFETSGWVSLEEAVEIFLDLTRAESPPTAKNIQEIVTLLKATCRAGARSASVTVNQFTLVVAGGNEGGWHGEVHSLTERELVYFEDQDTGEKTRHYQPGSVAVFAESRVYPPEHKNACCSEPGLEIPGR
ncbi:MAG: hypothetical protein A3D44_01115 [Candidatus Staskawiczbacteria bacterium RIFCSPHIGHO2_02_FULL_42_22]|uniref:Uncharacterized protein n=1 Tax=Candidatus Staskawiczbacteria bacterium RIFCSPHIGHO2_02_FULL_42_22 TaxID=1802207 RepID=A0A1G2I3D3_9BACT|nr:MAG: hypothetical protein A3D44_01115 [Candidatus Staskawiczbacteria bacterium RIFCSPHIGHO2_02_FULL_42_22]